MVDKSRQILQYQTSKAQSGSSRLQSSNSKTNQVSTRLPLTNSHNNNNAIAPILKMLHQRRTRSATRNASPCACALVWARRRPYRPNKARRRNPRFPGTASGRHARPCCQRACWHADERGLVQRRPCRSQGRLISVGRNAKAFPATNAREDADTQWKDMSPRTHRQADMPERRFESWPCVLHRVNVPTLYTRRPHEGMVETRPDSHSTT